jgi:hypothetical protein
VYFFAHFQNRWMLNNISCRFLHYWQFHKHERVNGIRLRKEAKQKLMKGLTYIDKNNPKMPEISAISFFAESCEENYQDRG